MPAKLYSFAPSGIEARPIDVEVDVARGLHQFKIVGLADKAVEEAKERITVALRQSGAKPPQSFNQRVVVNLAPADLKKQGTHFDLPIAIAFLMASEQLRPKNQKPLLAAAELGLDGSLRPVSGILPASLLARKLDAVLLIAKGNQREAELSEGVAYHAYSTIQELMEALERGEAPHVASGFPQQQETNESDFDLSFIAGQAHAKRALEIAAAGAHNVLLYGPPGSGKTLLVRALPTILPPLTPHEALEVTAIWSVAGLLNSDLPLIAMPPFRAPHHSASRAALIGGGSGSASPGEVSLSHRGVLFLDEFPEFQRHVLEALRQPMEDGMVTVARSEQSTTFPARFMLIAAMNPCPCGHLDDPEIACKCSAGEIMRYKRRVSGPMLDRIDLFVSMPRMGFQELRAGKQAEPSVEVRKRVVSARNTQTARQNKTNAEILAKELDTLCKLNQEAEKMLEQAHQQMHLSPRAVSRVLKVARTVADIENSADIQTPHLAEALQYRQQEE